MDLQLVTQSNKVIMNWFPAAADTSSTAPKQLSSDVVVSNAFANQIRAARQLPDVAERADALKALIKDCINFSEINQIARAARGIDNLALRTAVYLKCTKKHLS
ncbi:hypothetical protein K0U07_06025 [bacterium]|nr:hypothetical protein [bacterium]